ncbi:UvrD-helicase domain-containing protein [Nocardia sp. NBC_00565]|uniref:UvrD-helicase domain-containing protein n=1 Tax=Nocardia sp. NBC_00565 TaxID=2975993 RepID=UPI002E80F9AC|nr:UvrD-helicase domain-containing protein [Nocardia sp. NBC_00565]WUB99897.1 UvrD-helicase domain-containing protein [Nocardia sp. NBC_00565]
MLGDASRHWQTRVADALARIPCLTSDHKNFFGAAPLEPGRHLLVHRGLPNTPRDQPDALLVCRTGIFALVFASTVPPELNRIRHRAETLFGNLLFGRSQYAAHDVQIVLMTPDRSSIRTDGRFAVAKVAQLDHTIQGRRREFRREQIERIVRTVAGKAGEYQLLEVDAGSYSNDDTEEALFERSNVNALQRDAALQRPFHEWMVFLDPDQLDLVSRNYSGPARFAGPAGTGKTVIALHRMARHAKRSTGRLLYTTFVATLAACQETHFHQLAPGTADRVKFASLHSWAMRFLEERALRPDLDPMSADRVFRDVWDSARGSFEAIEPHDSYWREEIDRVIKGRGIDDLDVYQRIDRTGRNGVLLDADQRRAVWEKLYTPYVLDMRELRKSDYSDVISIALAEIRNEPADPYDMVVVDEVQDMTLAGLQLAHAIAGGGGSSSLLLLGDGQQQVYAGGWRLADAGISLRGRGAVMRVNYRNRQRIWAHAAQIDAVNSLGGFDNEPVVLLRDAEVTLPDGEVVRWHGPNHYLEAGLVDAIRTCGKRLSDIAVLTRTRKMAERLAGALEAVGIPICLLESYDGTSCDAVKVGTVHRAKGLDFAAVLHPTEASPTEPLTGHDRDRAELAARQQLVAITRARDYVWIGIREH